MLDKICIIGGAGRVGLPLSLMLAKHGHDVMICDINEKTLETISSGKMPFYEEGAQDLLNEVNGKNLHLTSSFSELKNYNTIIVCIGTPVDEHLNPTYHKIKNFFKSILAHLKKDHIIVLRSTVYPETTNKIYNYLKSQIPGVEVCFCPERIAEGQSLKELRTLPQVVSGFSSTAINRVSEIFKTLTPKILKTTPLEAELMKLFTNSWRYIQFATANQFFMIAESAGANYKKIFEAMKYEYPRTKNFSSPGFAAGPCLLKDTMQLAAYAKRTFFLGHSSMIINEGLPDYIVEQAKKKLALHKSVSGILGMGFKANSDDPRDSLSYKLKKILEIESKTVLCSDEYIKDERFITPNELIEKSDIIFIAASHKLYSKLDFKSKHVINIWKDMGVNINENTSYR